MLVDKSRFIKAMGNCSKSVVINWALCQSCTIPQQLQHGVRYFDMRPGYLDYQDDFYFVHGVHGNPIRGMLISMRDFLLANEQEVIIVDFNHFHQFDGSLHERFVRMIKDVFGHKLLLQEKDDAFVNFTLEYIWKQKKQVFLTYKDADIAEHHPELWFGRHFIFSPWHNTDSISGLTRKLDELLENPEHQYQFNVFQAILTARKSTLALNPTSTLRDCLVVKCNAGIKKWLDEVFRQCKQGVNIVMCDYICEDNLIEAILKLNQIKETKPEQIYSSNE